MADSLLAELQATGARSCTWLVGRKVTGDFHVPMGATTFIALLEPQLQAEPPPPRVLTAAGFETVRQGWMGFGTLARPGFRDPSWDRGWLAQLEDDADGRRFAFAFQSDYNQSVIVLSQIGAQNTAYFFGEDDALRPFRL